MNAHPHSAGPATRLLSRPNGPVPAPRWFLGLDLGQRQDHSALAILHLEWRLLGRCAVTYAYQFLPELTIRSLQRYPLNMSYQAIPALVAARANQLEQLQRAKTPHLDPQLELIVDAGGPGGPIVDLIRALSPRGTTITPVLITNGTAEHPLKGGFRGVPRRDLITRLIQMIAHGCLACADDVANHQVLTDELLELSGADTQPLRSGAHDDLAIATALAAWAAVRDSKELAPGAQSRQSKLVAPDTPLF
jgi:hypothetical protein